MASGAVCCVFLPGQGEISRVAALLNDRLPDNVSVPSAFRVAGAVRAGRRHSTRCKGTAEGGARNGDCRNLAHHRRGSYRRRFRPGAHRPVSIPAARWTRLETVRAPKSSIDQRRGRAGRTEPGLCVRLWHEGQTGSLPQRPDPQISQADLTPIGFSTWRHGASPIRTVCPGSTRRPGPPGTAPVRCLWRSARLPPMAH